jgi:hypothetical protein
MEKRGKPLEIEAAQFLTAGEGKSADSAVG